jgi:NADPH-dependent 2,4-dienoyl-CoA reductase/sulfur reductase-like enzyme
MQEHLVIIGGVAAGTKAAAKARREKPDLKISLYNEGEYISYSECGLPYFIEGFFENSNRLISRTPEKFKLEENIDIFTRHKVTKILPDQKKIEVINLASKETFEVEYSKLLITTGASPIKPSIEGIELENVYTIRTINDAVTIKNQLADIKTAILVGAGYIGIEMAEALHNQGIDVTIVELSDQILPSFDKDTADKVQEYLIKEKKIKIITGDGVKKLIGDGTNKIKTIETNSGLILDADMAVIAIGVRPNIELIKSTAIEIGSTGAIKVNERMQTNLHDIYSAGDCAEQLHLVTGKPVWIPLGSTANKQGRVAAINMTGGMAKFKGVLGSHVAKAFEYTVAKTGIGEKEAKKQGIEYEYTVISSRDKAGYMPRAKNIIIKLLADKHTKKLIGAEIIGEGDVDKRINIVATALTCGMTVSDLLDVDITYAPAYSIAIDPILVAAQLLHDKFER